MYGPVNYKSGIIKTANSALFIDTNGPDVFDLTNDTFASELYIAPGLDSNGAATSNSSISVAVDSISANQDFGYIVTKTDG